MLKIEAKSTIAVDWPEAGNRKMLRAITLNIQVWN